MALPLVGIMMLLTSNDLMIASEDIVYDVVLNWAKTNYSVLEERQGILRRLARYIRFPYMTCPRLKKILTSDNFEPSVAHKLVLEALLFKAETSLSHRAAIRDASHDQRRFIERAYTYRPIKTVEFDVPHRQCIVYLDLTRKECNALYPSNQICSQKFHLGGQEFLLSACCNKEQPNRFHQFGLFLRAQVKGSVSLTVDHQFSVRWKPTQEFVIRSKGRYKFTGGESVGFRNLFGTSWASFIGEDSPYFINEVLHLRAELSIRL